MGTRLFGFFLDADGAPARVKIDDPVSLRISDSITKDGCPLCSLCGPLKTSTNSRAVKDVVAQRERDRFTIDERFANQKGLGDPLGRSLGRILDAKPNGRTVAEQTLKGRQVMGG